MSELIRVCVLCDEQYAAGTYRTHAAVHVPKRLGRQSTPMNDAKREAIAVLAAQGLGPSAIGRAVGLTRQRVHQILHPDELGRQYRADAMNAWKRSQNKRDVA